MFVKCVMIVFILYVLEMYVSEFSLAMMRPLLFARTAKLVMYFQTPCVFSCFSNSFRTVQAAKPENLRAAAISSSAFITLFF